MSINPIEPANKQERGVSKTPLTWEVIDGLTGETLKRFKEPGEGILEEISSCVLRQSVVHQGYLAGDINSREKGEYLRVWYKVEVLKQFIPAIKDYRSQLCSQVIDPFEQYNLFVKQVFIEQYCLSIISAIYQAIASKGYLRVSGLDN